MLIPAIHFPGTCSEVIGFYQKALNAELINVAYVRDMPSDSSAEIPAEMSDKIMHAELLIAGTRVNMCDVSEEAVSGSMFLFNIFFDTEDEVKNTFNKLSEGAKILTELGLQFWTSMYGELVDRFGVHWQLMTNS